MGQFDGRVVIVTGSSNGIGRASAQLFAREGAMVTLCGRDEKALNESKSIVLAENGNSESNVIVVSGDIRHEDVMKRTIDETLRKFGRLDVLVNNAGGSATTALEGSELDGGVGNYDYAMDLNTKSVLRLCQLAFPHLAQTKGEIVNVSSVAGANNGAALGFPFYSVAKAAQDQLTRNLAIYYITKGVRVNSVSPGPISTNIMQKHGFTKEMVKKLCDKQEAYFTNSTKTEYRMFWQNLALKGLIPWQCEDKLVSEQSRIPYQCIGKPEDVAEAILFLADRKRSNYIVGHQLVIDGGASLQMPLIADSPKIFSAVMAETMSNK